MDPLALLSNLHGDGPATLQRLRRYGCDTLAGLLSSPAGDLAPILGWEVVRAERFLREADVLLGRIGGGMLDVEEDAPEPVAPEPRRTLHVLSDEDDADESEEASAQIAACEPGGRRATDRPIDTACGTVSDTVGDNAGDEVGEPRNDRAEPEAASSTATQVGDDVDAEADDDDLGPEVDDEPADLPLSARVREEVLTRWRTLDAAEPKTREETLVPHTPDAPLTAPGRPLASSGIDGLDPVRLRALLRAGVTTVEELAAADPFALHQGSGLPFTLTSRLGFLARRAAAKAPAKPARATAGHDDAAGPFA